METLSQYLSEDETKFDITQSDTFDMSLLAMLPLTIKIFNCRRTNITEIPDILTSLTHLDCSYTKITKIPDTLTSLTYLDCYKTNITKIPDTLTSLVHLDCRNCKELVYIPNYIYDIEEIEEIEEIDYSECPKLVRNYPERLIAELIDNCPICFDDFGTGYRCVNGHVIHVGCQKEWERLNPGQKICPYCRGKFKLIEKEEE